MPPAPASLRCRFTLAAPPGAALAAVHHAGDVDTALAALTSPGAAPVLAGDTRLRTLPGIDHALVCRWAPAAATITCHGGPATVARLLAALTAAGAHPHDHPLPPADDKPAPDPAPGLWPDPLHAHLFSALARCPSPLAIDLLLDQPRRWATAHAAASSTPPPLAPAHLLRRLLTEPIVATFGFANIGKSTLLNSLAGRAVALVNDEPGTTRDHVGAPLLLDGLAVRWIDTPGVLHSHTNADPLAAHAADLAHAALAKADLIVLCRDAADPAPPPPLPPSVRPAAGVLRVALRCDRPAAAPGPDELPVSCLTAQGGLAVAAAVRAALVPDAALAHPGPWRFWTN